MERRRRGRVRKRRINEVEADVYTEMKVNAMGFNWKKTKKAIWCTPPFEVRTGLCYCTSSVRTEQYLTIAVRVEPDVGLDLMNCEIERQMLN